MTNERGVVFVAYGSKAQRVVAYAIDALRVIQPGMPYTVYSQVTPGLTNQQNSRLAKTTMLDWTPYRYTCYMDADTRVRQSLAPAFEAIEAGWDIAMAYSGNQGGDWLWHVGEDERDYTANRIGGRGLQLQCGVMFVARNSVTRRLFSAWAAEWKRWRGQDQGAFLRALYRNPVKLWILGSPWNSNRGAIITHRFGEV